MDRFVTGGEARVDRTHTGADFESGAVHHTQGRNEAIPGVDAVDGRDQADWAGGHDNFKDTSGRQKRLRATLALKDPCVCVCVCVCVRASFYGCFLVLTTRLSVDINSN